jgi:hypothetical protein
MNNSGKLADYLGYFEQQDEAGLLILDDPLAKSDLLTSLEKSGYLLASNWRELFRQLQENRSSCIVLNSPLDHEIYSIIKQYGERRGLVQITDRETMEYKMLTCDPSQAHLLLVVEQSTLSEIEKSVTIRDKAGMAERF